MTMWGRGGDLEVDTRLEHARTSLAKFTHSGQSPGTEKILVEKHENDDRADQIIIGIDFGTTYSGVAYVLTAEPANVYLVKEWPGSKGINYDKVPTLIRYNADGSVSWGYELDRASENRIEAIKLMLDPDQPKPVYVPDIDTKAVLAKSGKAPVEVSADYLAQIFQHATQKIASKYPPGYIDLLRKQYVLTVPAVWSDKAQDATLRAAHNAGIMPIKLIKEPEAAALYTLHSLGDRGLSVGDAFIVCDAGGGTVDLIAYEIVRKKPFELKELASANGGLAGSLMLNRRFEEHIKNVVGDSDFIKLRDSGALTRAMKHFNDYIKPGFYSSEEDEQYISFPKAGLQDRPKRGLSQNCITIKRLVLPAELQKLFEPVIEDIDAMVTDQMTRARRKRVREGHPGGNGIKAIFLVGGFGASEYLFARLREKHPDVSVIQPNDAWSAIVRGAVQYALSDRDSVSVISNVSPKHYGTSAFTFSIDGVQDVGERMHFDPFRKQYKIRKMYWFIHKDDDLRREKPIELDFFRLYPEHPTYEELQAEEPLLVCDLDAAPRHPKDGLIKQNCIMHVDLSAVPAECFDGKFRYEGGQLVKWKELRFKLVVTITGGPMQFSLICRGQQYGSVKAYY